MIIRINKGEIFVFFAAALMILLAGGCLNNTDYVNYQMLYNGVYSTSSLENGYVFLQNFLNSIGISYDDFRLITLGIFVAVINVISYKHVGNKTIILDIFYIFYALPYDVLNIRNTIGLAVFLPVFFGSVKSENKSKYPLYIAGYMLCVLFHNVFISYLIFVYAFIRVDANKVSDKRRKYEATIFLIVFVTLIIVSSSSVLSALINNVWQFLTRIVGIPGTKSGYFIVSTRFGWLLYSSCHVVLFATIAFVRRSVRKELCVEINTEPTRYESRLLETVFLCNALLTLFIPLLRVNTEMFRVFREMTVINYITYFVAIKYIPQKSIDSFISKLLFLISVLICFVVQVLPYWDKIFAPMFINNRFF